MTSTDKTRRRWLQFGIGTLLFAVLCAAGVMAGYRAGYLAGQDKRRRETVYAKNYDLADLIAPTAAGTTVRSELKTLENLVRGNIEPDSWRNNGGGGVIETYPSTVSVVVSHWGSVHDQVDELLRAPSSKKGAKRSRHPDRAALKGGHPVAHTTDLTSRRLGVIGIGASEGLPCGGWVTFRDPRS